MTQVSRPSNMPNRPAGVPENARYAALEGWFEVGELKDGRRFGPQRGYRKDDGTLLFEARFDDEGRLQGTYKRFHRDGSLAREGAFNEGVAVGTWTYRRGRDDFFPCSDTRAAIAECAYEERSRSWRFFDLQGREVIAGQEIDANAGWANDLFAKVEPDDILVSGALQKLFEKEADPVSDQPPADDGFFFSFTPITREPLTEAGYRNRYGEPLPADIVRFAEVFGRAIDLCDLETRTDVLPTASDGRLFEAILREHQQNPGRATALREMSACFLPLLQDTRGRLYGPCLVEERFQKPSNAFYRFDPASEDFDVVARTAGDFAYLLGTWLAAKTDALTSKALAAGYEKLRGRIVPIEPFDALHGHVSPDDDNEVEGNEEEDHRRGFSFQRKFNAPLYLFYRSQWVRHMLAGNVDGAYDAFRTNLDGGLNDERFKAIRATVPNEGMLGVYWLWRTFFLGDARIAEMISWCADSPSSLVREVAGIIGELLSGKRKALGEIADVMALREAFLAMKPTEKPDPNAASDDDEDEDEDDDAEDEDEDEDDSDDEEDEDEDEN